MPVIFNCPACGRELTAPDDALGVAGQCRFCGAAIVSPAAPGGQAGFQPSEAEAESPATGSPGAVPGSYAEGGPQQGPYLYPPTGELDLNAIVNEAWSTVTANWGIFVVACIVAQFLPSIVQQMVQLPMQFMPAVLGGERAAFAALVTVLCLLASVVVAFAALPLYYGLSYLTRHLWLHGTPEFTAIFHGYRRFWAFVFVPLLQALLTLPFAAPFIIAMVAVGVTSGGDGPSAAAIAFMVATGLFCVVGAIYVGLCTMLAPLEVVDRGCGAVEAVKASWEATRGHRLMLLAVGIVLSLIQMAGFLACCVGVLFTTPVVSVGQMIVYRSLRGITGTEY